MIIDLYFPYEIEKTFRFFQFYPPIINDLYDKATSLHSMITQKLQNIKKN